MSTATIVSHGAEGAKAAPAQQVPQCAVTPGLCPPVFKASIFTCARERSRYWTHANRPKGSLSLRSARSRPGGSGRCLRHVSKGNRWEAGKQESASVDRGAKYADDCPERLDGDKRWDARLPAGRPGVRTPLPTGQPRGSAVRPQRLADPQGPHECPGRPLRTRHFLVPTQAVKTEPTPPSWGTCRARCRTNRPSAWVQSEEGALLRATHTPPLLRPRPRVPLVQREADSGRPWPQPPGAQCPPPTSVPLS